MNFLCQDINEWQAPILSDMVHLYDIFVSVIVLDWMSDILYHKLM